MLTLLVFYQLEKGVMIYGMLTAVLCCRVDMLVNLKGSNCEY